MKSRNRGRHLLDGTMRGFLAESILPLTGLITASYLTRTLLPEGYGLFTLVASIVTWVEWTLASVYSRATLKVIGEAEDWRPLGTKFVHLVLQLSVVVTVVIFIVAGPLAELLDEPRMATYLRLLALEIPIFAIAQVHRDILAALGGFRERAVTRFWRWMSRLVFIIVLVQLGFSVNGAIVGNLAASLLELIVLRHYCRPPLVGAAPLPAGQWMNYAAPLFISTLCLRLFDVEILVLLKVYGGTAADIGLLGAAANLAILPRLFSLAFTPLLEATLRQVRRDGLPEKARDLGRDSLRLAFLLLPLAGLAAGAGREITRLIFGPSFDAAGTLFGWQMFGAVGMVVINISSAILAASGRPGSVLYFSAPMPIFGMVAGALLIPVWRAEGAAMAIAGSATVGAIVAVVVVSSLVRTGSSFLSLGRSVLLTAVSFSLAVYWPTPGAWVLVKLVIGCVLVIAGFAVLREFSAREVALVRSFLPWNRSAPS